MICLFKNKYIFRNTSELFHYYWEVYICASLTWFIVVFFHHSMFKPRVLVWPLIMINDFIWSTFLRDLTLLCILFISTIRYYCHLFIEKNIPVKIQSSSIISHRYFLSNIHFHRTSIPSSFCWRPKCQKSSRIDNIMAPQW